jgi:hypothetical protein
MNHLLAIGGAIECGLYCQPAQDSDGRDFSKRGETCQASVSAADALHGGQLKPLAVGYPFEIT